MNHSKKLEEVTRVMSDIMLAKSYLEVDPDKSYAHLLLMEFKILQWLGNSELLGCLLSLTANSPQELTLRELEILDVKAYQAWQQVYEYSFKEDIYEEDLENLYITHKLFALYTQDMANLGLK